MRILILTLGSRGDVQPFAALASALAGRGHDVTVATSRGFEAMIEAAGAQAVPLSVDIQALAQSPEIRRALRSLRGKIKAWRMSKDMMRRLLDDMWAAAQAVRPDLIVYHPKAFVAPYLAQALGATAVPGFLQPAFTPTGAFPNPLFPLGDLGRVLNKAVNRLFLRLTRLGFAAVMRDWRAQQPAFAAAPRLDVLAGYRPSGAAVDRLHAYSRHLLPPTDDWAARERITGAWLAAPSDWSPPTDLTRFLADGAPPVYVGFGSMPSEDAERVTHIVVDALDRSGQRGVLATGWGGLADEARSDRLYVLDAAPHDRLFPRCAAVVHHGGAGTTHEALRWGRPSVVCPVFGDQPFWGRRVAVLGAGPPPLPQKRLTANRLAAAITAALRPEIAAGAEQIGAKIRAEGGVEAAADVIDGMAR